MAKPWVIDSDTHVDETEGTWNYVDDEAFRPTLGRYENHPDGRANFWLIGGNKVRRANRDDSITRTTVATRELLDVGARLRHMDELGVEVQVIYPTIFIRCTATEPEVELNVTRSYNRWLADRTGQAGGRLRWVFVPSPLNMDETVADLRWARDHGACGILKKGDTEASHAPYDPFFFPLYEEAERLDLPICVHTGSGRPDFGDDRMPPCPPVGGVAVFTGIYQLIRTGVPARFPKLRFGAIEAGASWLPLVEHSLRRGQEREHLFHVERSEETSFEANHVYVTCQVSEDFTTILRYISEDNLLVGSDYSHHDISNEMGFIPTLQALANEGVIPGTVPRKILYDNAKAFYGL